MTATRNEAPMVSLSVDAASGVVTARQKPPKPFAWLCQTTARAG